MEHLSKIALKTIGSVPKSKSLAPDSKPYHVATVYGIVTSHKIDTTASGDYVKFKGQFEAVRASDGAAFKSANLILPRVIEEKLLAANSKSGIGFSFIIGVRYSKSANTGYEWTFDVVSDPQENDALADLRRQTAEAISHLEPTPKPEPKEAKGKGKGKH